MILIWQFGGSLFSHQIKIHHYLGSKSILDEILIASPLAFDGFHNDIKIKYNFGI